MASYPVALSIKNNDNKSLFLIDDIGRETFGKRNEINLKIMHLL